MHIGSPVYEIQPYIDAINKMNELIDRLTERGHKIEWFDMGGGFGVNYETPDQALPVTEHAKALFPLLKGRGYHVAFEPGRYIAGNAGIMLTRVLYRKKGGEKNFVIVDAGMNDLIRPTLYESYHHIWPVKPGAENVPPGKWSRNFEPKNGEIVDVVGPICESGDYLAKAPPAADDQARRSARGLHRRRLWLCDEQQLQQPPAHRRGAGGWRKLHDHPQARDARRSGRAGAALIHA